MIAMVVKIIDTSENSSPFCTIFGAYSTVQILCKDNVLQTFCDEKDAYKYINKPCTENTAIYINKQSIEFTTSRGKVIIPNSSIIHIRAEELER